MYSISDFSIRETGLCGLACWNSLTKNCYLHYSEIFYHVFSLQKLINMGCFLPKPKNTGFQVESMHHGAPV